MSTQKLSTPALTRLRWFANDKKGSCDYATGGGAAATDRGLERRGFIEYDGACTNVITSEGRAFLARIEAQGPRAGSAGRRPSTQKLSAAAVARLRWFADGRKAPSGYATLGAAAATDRGLERRGFIRYDGTAPDIITEEGRAFLTRLDSK